jgi:uncharacterized protein (DUF2236 family)
MAALVRTPVLGPLPRMFLFNCYMVDLSGSSADILWTFPHLEHSKIRRSGPSQLAPTWISIMRLWHAGQRAGVSESASVLDEHRPRTYEAPAHVAVYAEPEAAADDSRFAGCAVSMARAELGLRSKLLTFPKISG